MNIRFALIAAGLTLGAAALPAMAQTNATIAGTESAPGSASGAPSAATTMGNISTTTTTPGGGMVQTSGGGPLPLGTVNTSANSITQTPGSPANSGK